MGNGRGFIPSGLGVTKRWEPGGLQCSGEGTSGEESVMVSERRAQSSWPVRLETCVVLGRNTFGVESVKPGTSRRPP